MTIGSQELSVVGLHDANRYLALLREEQKGAVFENRTLGRMCGYKKEEVTGDWRKIQDEENCSGNITMVRKLIRVKWKGY
jgi:hypothetical protein